MVSIPACPSCLGRGHIIEKPCESCQGSGIQFNPHVLKVHIPPGIDDNMMIRLAGQGERHREGGSTGDLFIRPHLQCHPSLQRHGDDLYASASINLVDAALGTEVNMSGLGGEKLIIKVPAGTQSGTALRISGKGMPRLKRKGKGDLFMVVEVRTPTDLTPKQKELLNDFRRLEKQRNS